MKQAALSIHEPPRPPPGAATSFFFMLMVSAPSPYAPAHIGQQEDNHSMAQHMRMLSSGTKTSNSTCILYRALISESMLPSSPDDRHKRLSPVSWAGSEIKHIILSSPTAPAKQALLCSQVRGLHTLMVGALPCSTRPWTATPLSSPAAPSRA
jgi:hypothetical protein